MRTRHVLLLLVTLLLCSSPPITMHAQQSKSPTPQATIDDVVRLYCEAWSEPDVARRRVLLERAWTDDGTYTDPMSHLVGRDALVHRITEHLTSNPGTRILRSSQVDAHHGLLRFTWTFVKGDGTVITEGIDFGEVASDGRLRRIVGFFGPVKPLP